VLSPCALLHQVEHLLGPYVLPSLSVKSEPFLFGGSRSASQASHHQANGAAADGAACPSPCKHCQQSRASGGFNAVDAPLGVPPTACTCGGEGCAGELPWFARMLLDPECLSPEGSW
jgi:hypothetical protein